MRKALSLIVVSVLSALVMPSAYSDMATSLMVGHDVCNWCGSCSRPLGMCIYLILVISFAILLLIGIIAVLIKKKKAD